MKTFETPKVIELGTLQTIVLSGTLDTVNDSATHQSATPIS